PHQSGLKVCTFAVQARTGSPPCDRLRRWHSGLPLLPPSSPTFSSEVEDLLPPMRLEHLGAYLTLVLSQALSFFDRGIYVVDIYVSLMRLLLHHPAFLCVELNFESDSTLTIKPSGVDPLVLIIAPNIFYYSKLEAASLQPPG